MGLIRVHARVSGRHSRVLHAAFLVAAVLIGVVGAGRSAQASPSPMPLISRGVPTYASSQIYPASAATDSDYGTNWRGAIPGWIALDLSHVPAAQRAQVIVAWYNDPATSPYDHTVVGDVAYNNLRDYTVQGNAAAGGTGAPTTGWVTLATVTGNRYHSRSHLVDLTGYNWVRLNITAGDGSSGNSDASINLDVHDASQGAQDSWIFFGDSVTEDGMFHYSDGSNVGNFSQLINASRPGSYPAYEDGGTWGLISADGAQHMASWLATSPARYVALDYGTNDANGCASTAAFYNNYVTMVQAVLNAGKVPVVPTIPWARTANVQNCGPGFNAQIQSLYNAYPQIVKGPDFWTFFKNNPTLIGSDNLHPSTAGYGAYRQQWANTMLANVYTAASGPAVTLAPSSLSFGSQGVGTASPTQTVSLRNSGTAPLSIASIGLSGSYPGDYSRSNDCPSSLAAGSTCTITVRFEPTATGSRPASVTVSDNAADSPQSVPLSGTGVVLAPAVTLTPSSIGFGSQLVGTTSATQSSTLKNAGSAALTISSMALVGAYPGDYSQTNTCPSSLAANATCTISVSFTPAGTGSRPASVQVTDNAADSPQSLGLSGTGTTPSPAVTLNPASVSFGSQRVGTPSTPQTASLRNSGTAPLAISSIALGGANPGDYTESSDCPISPVTLGAGSSCTITLGFQPRAAGSRPASVVITDDAADNPQSVPLSGTGTNSSIAFDKSLGTNNENVGSTTMKLTTSAASVPGSRIFAFVTWNNATRTLTSLSGGGLAWSVDVQAKDGGNNHGAIASADAPAGLPAGTVLSATFSGSVGHGLIAAASFTGIASASPLDGTGTRTQAGATAWTDSVTTTNPTDLVLAWSGIDTSATSTPAAPNVEIHDFGDQWFNESSTSTYRIESSAGPKTLSGTWSRATGSSANVTVAAAYRAS